MQTEREKEALKELLNMANNGLIKYGKKKFTDIIKEENMKPKLI